MRCARSHRQPVDQRSPPLGDLVVQKHPTVVPKSHHRLETGGRSRELSVFVGPPSSVASSDLGDGTGRRRVRTQRNHRRIYDWCEAILPADALSTVRIVAIALMQRCLAVRVHATTCLMWFVAALRYRPHHVPSILASRLCMVPRTGTTTARPRPDPRLPTLQRLVTPG